MRRLLKVLAFVFLAFLALLIPAYWWLIVAAEEPQGTWPIDLAEVRKLASARAGDKPTEVRVEWVGDFEFPTNAVVAGWSWAKTPMRLYSYQLVFPTRTAIIDTAMEEKYTAEMGMPGFDRTAYARIQDAMVAADFIVVTHEHADHIGGILTHPKSEAVLKHALLTPEQINHSENYQPLTFPPGAKEKLTPLTYDKLHAVAPGVVLLKTPGHTAGSQMVYVQTADGTEFLFLGDVAWQKRNVDMKRERARIVTLLMKEDRSAVLRQLQALHDLASQVPELHQLPGHEATVVPQLVEKGVMKKGFVVQANAAQP